MLTVETKKQLVLNGGDIKTIKGIVASYKKQGNQLLFDNVKFHVKGNILNVAYTSTDYVNYEVTIQLNMDYENEFSFLFPINAIKKMKHAKKHIHIFTITEYGIIHETEGIETVYESLSTDSYPIINNLSDNFEYVATLNYNSLKNISLASLTVAKSDRRPILQNILLRSDKVFSTDSHHLFKGDLNVHLDKDILIPKSVVQVLDKFTNKNSRAEIYMTDSDKVKIICENVAIIYQLNAGGYPKVDGLLEINNQWNFVIQNTTQLKNFLKQVIKMKKKNNAVILTVNEDCTKIQLQDQDKTMIVTIPIECIKKPYDSKPICFNAQFLLNAIEQMSSLEIEFNMQGSTAPFTVTNRFNNNITLILPIRVY